MSMFKALTKFLGDSNEREVRRLRELIDEINGLEEETKQRSDEQLGALTPEFKKRLASGESLDDLLPEAFAAVREAARRTLGQRHFDVQLIGGIVLHSGKIAEMKTGEGKTLVATLPAYLNALVGGGVHVVTVNDYLARRDAAWMGPVYGMLGMTVGCLQNQASFKYDPAAAEPAGKDGKRGEPMRAANRREAYAADITYGTNNEFGFDYLRDNMVDSLDRKVQRSRDYAIVDEVDNILIDEARTPLIISGPAPDRGQQYQRFAQLARRLEREKDFTVEEKSKSISLTQDGITKIEKVLGISNLYDPEHYALTHFVENSVRAEVVYMRDRDYVVREGEVLIVDEFTGRLMVGRRYSEGLHQAIEAKEGVRIREESITYATITLQNYFRLYKKLSGMTGTAATEAEEFFKIYKLEVVQVPTNREMVREDLPDLIYKTESAKYNAVAELVKQLNKEDRPVLIGTTSIEKSERLSELLKKRGLRHEVLNAKQHEREAVIVAEAGRPAAITVATNMAGRGTDIILGGNPALIGITREEWQKAHDRVIEVGGLFIIGTERHEARRIDNQLRGRAGRQGDPGTSRFFASTEDDLMRRFGGDRIKGIMNFVGLEEDVPIENRMVSRAVEQAQSRVEGYHFEIRKHLVDYDDVVNTHRSVIYRLRDKVLAQEELRPTIEEMVGKELDRIAGARLQGEPEDWDIDGLFKELQMVFPQPAEMQNAEAVRNLHPGEIEEILDTHAVRIYDERNTQFGPDVWKQIERVVLLRTIDKHWVEHLTAMENMRTGIGLEAVGQRDPLVQYKQTAYGMFGELMGNIESEVAHTIFRVAPVQQAATPQPNAVPARGEEPGRPMGGDAVRGPAAGSVLRQKSVMAAVASGHGADASSTRKVGRNEFCPCGSGKKYKRCHGANA